MEARVVFQPSGCRGSVTAGITVMEAARRLGADMEGVCGGRGICGKCKVKVEDGLFEKLGLKSSPGNLSPVQPEEKEVLSPGDLDLNFRLACLACIQGDVLIYVPEESRCHQQVILESGREVKQRLNPAVRKHHLVVEKATLTDQRSDFKRIKDALAGATGFKSGLGIDYNALKDLPVVLRHNTPPGGSGWEITVSVRRNREIIRVEPGLSKKCAGLALDIGTTTVVGYLCDLNSGDELAVESMMNPQVRYGEDIISRITYSMNNTGGLSELQGAIIGGINSLAGRASAKAGLTPADIMDMTVVGNTAMHHIALGIETAFLGRAPFAAAVKDSLDIKARDLGIQVCPSANVHFLPVEAGFVGADNVAVLISEQPYKHRNKVWMTMDIGTNCEINMGCRKKILSTSCATGPALEGAQIKHGMRAAPGAVECVRINRDTLDASYKVIGNDSWFPPDRRNPARGICGSGIIDIVAEFFKTGIIDRTGRFDRRLKTPRLRAGEQGVYEYVLAWAHETATGKDITFTQGDVRAVQLAKAALYTGAAYLQEKLGSGSPDVILLAGAFGSYINKENAMVIGMIPDCPLASVSAVGNAAGSGSRLALLDVDKRREAAAVARRAQYVETAVEKDFQKRFVEAMAFPHATHRFNSIQHILSGVP